MVKTSATVLQAMSINFVLHPGLAHFADCFDSIGDCEGFDEAHSPGGGLRFKPTLCNRSKAVPPLMHLEGYWW